MAGPAKTLVSTFSMAMMTAAAVVSLRGLPMMAKEQLTLFVYIAFATFIFLIPAALVSAELGGAFGEKGGGVYTWVKEAFGARWGFVAIWLQWIQNVVWYPTVLAFSAAAIAYVVGQARARKQRSLCRRVLHLRLWAATMDIVARRRRDRQGDELDVSRRHRVARRRHHDPGGDLDRSGQSGRHAAPRRLGRRVGHVDGRRPPASALFPRHHRNGRHRLSRRHHSAFRRRRGPCRARQRNGRARRSSSRSRFWSRRSSIILLFTLGSFAVATVLPNQEINLQEGLMKAFQQIFASFGIGWATPVVCLLLAFGGLGGVMSWISGPSRGLLWTAQEGEIPPLLAKTNKHGVQVNILIVQGVIVTILALTYFVMADVSVAFFLLSAMTISLYLIMYMLMYAAAIRLRYSQPDLKRSYRVPGGIAGMWSIAGVGFAGVVFAFIVSFFPPSQLPVGSPALYVGLVVAGTVIFTGLPLLISMSKQPSWRAARPQAVVAPALAKATIELDLLKQRAEIQSARKSEGPPQQIGLVALENRGMIGRRSRKRSIDAAGRSIRRPLPRAGPAGVWASQGLSRYGGSPSAVYWTG